MYKATVYNIEGPRSVSEAARIFNKADHSSKVYNKKSGVSVYVKHFIGKDFSVRSLIDRDGVLVDEQVTILSTRDAEFHIKLKDKAVGKKFNAILITEEHDGLIRPVYLIGDIGTITVEKPNWINIDILRSKLEDERVKDIR